MWVSIDNEFMENGSTIELLSLALVKSNGQYLYLINRDANLSHANEFVKTNVIPKLRLSGIEYKEVSHSLMGVYIINFLSNPITGKIFNDLRFFGYYADYDWVVFCQIFGTMMDLPEGFPMYCRDIKQTCDELEDKAKELNRLDLLTEYKANKYRLQLPGEDETTSHNSLYDAWWNWKTYFYLKDIERELNAK